MKGGMRLALALIASALLIDLVLIQPNHPNALSWRALRLAPLELPVLLLGLLSSGVLQLRHASHVLENLSQRQWDLSSQ